MLIGLAVYPTLKQSEKKQRKELFESKCLMMQVAYVNVQHFKLKKKTTTHSQALILDVKL